MRDSFMTFQHQGPISGLSEAEKEKDNLHDFSGPVGTQSTPNDERFSSKNKSTVSLNYHYIRLIAFSPGQPG